MTVAANLAYLARRAEREAVLAVMAADARVSAIHEELCGHYSRRLLHGLSNGSPRHCHGAVTLIG